MVVGLDEVDDQVDQEGGGKLEGGLKEVQEDYQGQLV